MQVDPIKPMLKPPGTKCLKLKYDEVLSNFAFKSNLHRYTLAGFATAAEEDEAVLEQGGMAARMEMCVRYRLLQKRNLQAFQRFLDAV